MESSWSLLKRHFHTKDAQDMGAGGSHEPPPLKPDDDEGPAVNGANFDLGAIGMQDEMIRARISHMVERFEDVASLKSEFASLVDPLAGFAAEYPQLRAKLVEAEAMLGRER